MKTKTKLLIAGSAVAVLAAAGSGVAVATSDDRDVPITGDALKTASEAALGHTGEGRVTGTEVEDEESYYEVEVTLDNGRQVDVQLDEQFNVVDQTADDDSSENSATD